MTREKMKGWLPIFQAYAEGKPIEYKEKGKEEWRKIRDDADRFNFDFAHYEYRIKPEPKYRPFKDAQECWEEMQKHQPFGWVKEKEEVKYRNITAIMDDIYVTAKGLAYSYSGALEFYTFTDGTPFGKLEE